MNTYVLFVANLNFQRERIVWARAYVELNIYVLMNNWLIYVRSLMTVHIVSAIRLILRHIFRTVVFFNTVFWGRNSTGIDTLSTRIRWGVRPLNFMTVKMKNVALHAGVKLLFKLTSRTASCFDCFIRITGTFRIQIGDETFLRWSSITWNNGKVFLWIGS